MQCELLLFYFFNESIGRALAALPAGTLQLVRIMSRSQARKKRTTNYKKRQQQYGGAKDRLRYKCKELTQSLQEVIDDKSDLEKAQERLSKENFFLKR